MSSASRGLDPRKGLECLVDEDGPHMPASSATPWAAGRQVWDPRSQNGDSSPRAQGALGLRFEAKPKGKCGAPRAPTAYGLG